MAERSPGQFRHLAELLALTAFAIAQPVLDVTGRAPDFFLYRRANPNEMKLFIALVVLLPPLGLWAVECVVRVFSRAAAKLVHLVFVAALFGLLLVQIGKKTGPLTGVPLAVAAGVLGTGLAVLLARLTTFRQMLLYATPAPLVFALLFVLTAPAGALVRGSEIDRGKGRFIANRPPIVFLFLDEFPLRALLDGKGEIDAKLFPNFARLAKLSTWYPNATGVTGWTPFAAPAMLGGRYPERAVAASYIEYPETLFTLLAETYEMRAYETIAELCPPGMCRGVATGRATGMRALGRDTIDLTRELVSPYKAEKTLQHQFVENAVGAAKQAAQGKPKPGAMDRFDEAAKNQPERFGPFLADLQPMERPNLHFMHLLLPHSPYRYLPSGNAYQRTPQGFPPERPDPTKPKLTTPSDPVFSVIEKQRLLLQTVYTDRLIGAMLDRMTETGLLDQALLIVTADHGTGIEPRHKYRQMDEGNPADIAWVPLFVKTPKQKAGKVDRRNEMHVDLLPTIADVLDVTIPWRVDGQSVLGPARTTQRKTFYDVPGTPEYIDPARWQRQLRLGYAAEVAQPSRGPKGLYAVGPLGEHVGKKVGDFAVGSPAGITADLDDRIGRTGAVDPPSGEVPAGLYGTLSRPAGTEPGWWLASVNGTIAGAVGVMPSDGTWRFLGMVDDSLFVKGRNDVRLWTYDGGTLHEVTLTP